jgi:hypothetical protein
MKMLNVLSKQKDSLWKNFCRKGLTQRIVIGSFTPHGKHAFFE